MTNITKTSSICFQHYNERLILPSVALVEVSYLIQARLGHFSMRRFIQGMEQSPLHLEHVTQADIPRIHSLLDQYSNLELDFVDASLVAISERLNVTRILTGDKRDFTIIRPEHCDYFELLL